MLADEGDILEVVQDTFVAAWRRLDSFRGESSMRTWLSRSVPEDRGQLSNQESSTDRRQIARSSRAVSRGRPVRHDLELRVPRGTGRSVG
ncbi:sigma factor [Rhodococcus sp. 3Y1]